MTAQELERNHQKIQSLNRLLCWLLPVAVLGAGADLFQWNPQLNVPVRSLSPSLEELTQPLPAVAAVAFPAALFEHLPSVVSRSTAEAQQPTQVAAKEAQWKLRGVWIGEGKRAFLEDESGKSVWVSEGDRVGSAQVMEIRERSVRMEGEKGEYEIRM